MPSGPLASGLAHTKGLSPHPCKHRVRNGTRRSRNTKTMRRSRTAGPEIREGVRRTALVKVCCCRPFANDAAAFAAGNSKPPREETAGDEALAVGGSTYGDLRAERASKAADRDEIPDRASGTDTFRGPAMAEIWRHADHSDPLTGFCGHCRSARHPWIDIQVCRWVRRGNSGLGHQRYSCDQHGEFRGSVH